MNTILLGVFLLALCILLVHYRPRDLPYDLPHEGFAVATDPIHMPACVQRSTAAQRILAAIATYPASDEAADEIRLLLSKLTCIEADISTNGAGKYRTLPLQFRTSHDMEPPTSFVGRCLNNAIRQRDIDLVMDKYTSRGKELIKSRCPEMQKDFEDVLATTRMSMVSFCLGNQPSMDKPMGVRDPGFWESANTDLRQYEGVSASPRDV